MSQNLKENDFVEPEWLFPFEAMDVGDSFFIPTLKPAHMVYVIDTRAKAAKCKIRLAVQVHEDCLGVRVWRIG